MTTVDARPVLAWPPRPPRLVLGRPAGQLVCWQVAVLLVLAAIGQPVGQVVALGAGAAVLVAATGWRYRGRWAYEWAWLWLRFRARRRRGPAGRWTSAELALLATAARTQAISDVEVDGVETALVEHAGGLTAILELTFDEVAGVLPAVPLDLLPPDDGTEVSVQLIVHSRPIPATVTQARAWLAVQVLRVAGAAHAELRPALVTAVRRVQRRLREERLAARAVNTARLPEVLSVLTRLELTAARPDRTGHEDWWTWWTVDVPQESLRIRRWPGLPAPPGADVFAALLSTPSLAQTISLAARRVRPPYAHGAIGAGREAIAVELSVRLAERDRAALDAATRWLTDRLARAGVTVERLDGRQLPALAATLPLGGFPPP